MGITCPVFLVNAFTSRAFTGNPAGVCLLRQSIEDSLMQNIATELGYAETAFVLYKEKTPILRWFTPQVEIDLCGHATLACSHVLFSKEYFDESGVYQSKSGSLQVRRIGGSIVISFPRKDVEPVEDDVNLRQILGIKRSVPIFRVADDTFATRLLLLPCVEDLQKVQPEFERLRSLRKAVIITAKSEESIQGKEIDFVSRFFAPHVGINEDSVTGEKMVKDRKKTEKLTKSLYDMVLIRIFEERSAQLYGMRKIGGFCHLYIGQEAVAVGSIAVLDLKKDYVLTSYRDHGHALAMGVSARKVMAELYGKETGCSKGKGGSMHLFDIQKHFYGGNGIVGSQIPVATGIAYKQRYTKDGGVTLCFFGDGAIHQGAFHESLNLAKIWQLPIVYIVENNIYGMGTAASRVSSITDFEKMAAAYDLLGVVVDGMDYFDVVEKTKEAVYRARKNGIASLLHVKTYRYRGHSMSDPAKYRSKQEVESYKQMDPIEKLKGQLIKEGLLSGKEYEKMRDKIKEVVEDAVRFAEESPQPALESLHADVYAPMEK
ncbi:hypothetical protein LSH36_793g01243 [Paralvinella palmiformis]|uniref:Pyruvate dehydrogenase E1 component subunit alpha n=1 Tax=Paralvinella palmiformis TaxID=53620 RepID=A0AAD9J109_9ANNE|nr:hypothetical protein LSH36_793g01243 [Paralvinella palmiformis]